MLNYIFKRFEAWQLDRRKKEWFENVTSQNPEYFENASAKNFQRDRTKIKLEKNTVVRGHLKVLKYGGQITIGKNSYVGNNSAIWSGDSVLIEENVLVSDNVFICDTNSHEINSEERLATYLSILQKGAPAQKGNIRTAPIVIKKNAWINYGAVILKGVTIGEGAIIGAGSVVTKSVPDRTFAAGNPARIIRKIDEEPSH
jgi:acetyltransferase-like isoleucine patch superfamily enzyme